MGSRLGRRVVHFANLPITPSASKIEIKRVLESLYGFEVEKVRTLNMDGKKKKRGGLLIAKPDYKKAYVTLKNPLSISPDLYPIKTIEEDKRNMAKPSKKSSIVEDAEPKTPHWLDGERSESKNGSHRFMPERFSSSRGERVSGNVGGRGTDGAVGLATKFPWSSMKPFAR